jgi:hypothetical protein
VVIAILVSVTTPTPSFSGIPVIDGTNLSQEKSKGSAKACAKIKLERDLGPEISAALADPKTIEIMLNSDDKRDYPLNQTLLR